VSNDATALLASPRVERRAAQAFVVVWAVWMGLLGAIWTAHPDLHHGLYLADGNVLHAGVNYDAYGISALAGLPRYDTVRLRARVKDADTHYPPLPYWLHQAWKYCGARELAAQRAVGVAFSALGGLLAFWFFSSVAGSRLVGALAGGFYLLSLPFANYADGLHQTAYMQVTLFGALLCWLVFERRGARAWPALLASALLLFVDGWLSFEHLAMVPIFVGLRWIARPSKRRLVGALVIGAVPFLVLGSRLAHNAALLGSFEAAVADFRGAARHRSGLSADSGPSWSALAGVWRDRLGGSDIPAAAHEAEFRVPLLRPVVLAASGVLLAAVLLRRDARRSAPLQRGLGAAAALLLAGGFWILALRQHAYHHQHLILLLLPAFALLLGTLAAFGLARRTAPAGGPGWARWAGPAAAILLVGGWLLELRGADALNRIAVLDEGMHAKCRFREEVIARAAAAAPAFEDVVQIRFGGPYPELAARIERPKRFVLTAADDELRPRERLWIELWNPPDTARALAALQRYGFPDLLSAPAVQTRVFRGEGTPGRKCRVAFGEGIQLTGVRAAATLDGGAYAVQTRFEGTFDEAVRADLIMNCALLPAGGAAGRGAEAGLRWAFGDDRVRVARHDFEPVEALAAGALELSVWSISAERRLEISADPADIPTGATISADRTSLIWPLESAAP